MSFVPQMPMFFEGTIEENLRLAAPCISRSLLAEYAEVTRFDEVLAGLEHGWNERLGVNGALLSAGGKQRLALLRALIQNRSVLILDESTSALDFDSEHELLTALKPRLADKIVFFITHRPTILNFCDHILHLQDGQISERLIVDIKHPMGNLRNPPALTY